MVGFLTDDLSRIGVEYHSHQQAAFDFFLQMVAYWRAHGGLHGVEEEGVGLRAARERVQGARRGAGPKSAFLSFQTPENFLSVRFFSNFLNRAFFFIRVNVSVFFFASFLFSTRYIRGVGFVLLRVLCRNNLGF